MKSLFRSHPRLIVLFVLAVAVVAIRLLVPMYTIGSGSMGMTLPVGTTVFLGSADHLEQWDVITFQAEGEDAPTTHTFIGYAEDGSLQTKGDANPTPDVHTPPLTQDDVLGKVVFALTMERKVALLLIVAVVLLVIVPSGRKSNEEPESQSSTTDTERVTIPA